LDKADLNLIVRFNSFIIQEARNHPTSSTC